LLFVRGELDDAHSVAPEADEEEVPQATEISIAPRVSAT